MIMQMFLSHAPIANNMVIIPIRMKVCKDSELNNCKLLIGAYHTSIQSGFLDPLT